MHRSLVRSGLAAAVAVAVLQLAACGSGGDSSTAASAPAITAGSVGGTVATGGALTGATVTLTDANGKQATATTDTQGAYTISVTGLSAPFLLVATDPTGINAPLTSVLARLPNGIAPAVVNITPLTTALAAMLTASGNPSDLAVTTTLANLTASSVQLATITLDTILANILAKNGIQPAGYDPIGTPFTANHTGADGVIDTLTLVLSANGGLSLVSNAAPGTPVALNNTTTSAVTLPAPGVAANFLQPIAALLTACAASNTLNTACSPAIDNTFMENGSTDLAVGHDLTDAGFNGAVFGSPKTLEFFTVNGQQRALVSLPFTLASGQSGALYTVAQALAQPVTLAGGTQLTWDLIGNQSQYSVAINSQISQRTFLDTRLNDVNRYESGLTIVIPTTATANQAVYSASVTGPGINAPLWLLPRNEVGVNTLGLSAQTLSAPPVSPTQTSGNTALYRWSWQTLATGTSFTPPASSGSYAAQPINVANVPLYATYTVTLFNQSGAQIGQSSVINPGNPLAASAGSTIAWPGLLPGFVSDFLSPTGQLAAVQFAMSVSWSGLDNQNVAYPVTSVHIQGVPGTGAGSTVTVDGYSSAVNNTSAGQFQTTVSAGVSSAGVQTCVNCPFPALVPGASRSVQLTGGQSGVGYYAFTEYND